MPQALICPAPHRLEWREIEDRNLGSGEVRIKVEFGAAKHGTEMTYFKGKGERNGIFDPGLRVFRPELPSETYPMSVGNMAVGIVNEAATDVGTLALGDRVLCYAGFQDIVIKSARICWKLSAQVSWKSGVCVDPADFAMGAIRDGHVRLGDSVAVFGLGAIGLMTVQLLKATGASEIIAIDPLPGRRILATTFGASLVLDPGACDAGMTIKEATAGRGADVVIEFSGSRRGLQAAQRGCAYGGNVVLGAFAVPYDEGLDFGREGHMNNVNMLFSRACSEPNRDYPRWDEQRILTTCLKMFADGVLCGDEIVTPVVSVGELQDAYLALAAGKSDAIKIGVRY